MRRYLLNKKSLIYSFLYSIIAPIFCPLFIGEIYVRLTAKEGILQWIQETNSEIFILLVILFFLIPTLYIFLEYLYFNRRTIIEFKDENLISISNSKGNFYYSTTADIRICCLLRETKGWAFHTASNFSVASLEFKDGSKFIITCLLEWDLKFMLTGIDYIEKRSVFPSILIYKLFKII